MGPRNHRKVGRPPKWVLDRDGKPIVGLSFDKGTAQTFYTWVTDEQGIRKRKGFGRNEPEAIFHFRQWQAEQTGKQVQFKYEKTLKGARKVLGVRDDGKIILDPNPVKIDVTDQIPESQFIEAVREFLLNDIHEARRKLDLPGLEIRNAPSAKDSLSLADIGHFYCDNSGITKKEIGECQRAWKEFLNTISASTIAEVTDNDIFLFNDVIWKKYKRDSLSSTWIRGRFTRIKTILKFYIKRGRDNRAEIRRVLDLCASFELPPKTGKLAQAISKSNFQTLIDNADVKWKLIYLLGLNCGYYASDISNLKRDYIRSEEGVTYTVYPRPKNAGIRINVFWDITVATYKEYLRECDFISPYLFKNVAGGKLTEHSIRRGFARRRRHLGLPSSLKFENLRDGAASAMFGRVADKELRNVTLGHRISDEEEKYITLHPEMVRQCSDAIYQHYFA